jgi:hypothetical protein
MTVMLVFRPNVVYVLIMLGALVPPFLANMAVAMYRNKVKESAQKSTAVEMLAPAAGATVNSGLLTPTAAATPASATRPAPLSLPQGQKYILAPSSAAPPAPVMAWGSGPANVHVAIPPSPAGKTRN